jgi:pilus assembly protein CpaB
MIMARISPGTMTAAIFAILVGLAGAYGVRQYLKPANIPHVETAAVEPAPEQMVFVPVAARDMTTGQKVAMNDIIVHKMTREKFSKSEFAKLSFMPDTRQVIGRTLRVALKQSQVFGPSDFYSDDRAPGVAELLKLGFRAVTIGIENIGAVEGFARPGTLVDVFYRAIADEVTPEVTMTLLERVEVLAVGTTAVPGQTVTVGNGTSRKGSVTLSVTPEQAKALRVVEGHGSLTLALRHPDDQGSSVTSLLDEADGKMTLEQLVGPKPAKRVLQVEIYRGTAKQVLSFESNRDSHADVRFGGLIRTPIASEVQLKAEPTKFDTTETTSTALPLPKVN